MSLLDKKNFDADQRWYTNGTRIAWFDRSLKLWTSYLVDGDGNQRSETSYANNKANFAELEALGHFDDDKQELADNIANDFWG